MMRTPDKPWYRKQNSTWYVKINGKQVRLSKDRAEARRLFHKLVADGGLPKDSALHDCVEHYLATLAPKTRRTREQVLTAFEKHVGRIKAGNLTKRHMRTFIKPTWSPSTVRSHLKTILACLNQCVKD